ncbi:MAG: hypothetical protein AAB116_02740 [Candidatus Poribacteria bacterium]
MFTDLKTQTYNLSKDYKHVYLDENENPCVANVEIRQIAEDENIHKWSVRKIKKMYHLTFAQIHSALAFYFDSEEEEKRAMDYGREYQKEMKSVDGYKYVAIEEEGIPTIKPTTMKIELLIKERRMFGFGVKRQQEGHPYLTIAQIHSALSYYFDHKKEIDADIKRRNKFVEEMRKKMGPSPLAEKIRAIRESRCQ